MFELPKEVVEGTEEYKRKLQDFLEEDLTENFFKGIRVPWGIYSQRGGEKYMLRIRIPGGIAAPDQLAKIADVAREFTAEKPHLTTRQDVQLHGVDIADSEPILDELGPYQLSTRGGGGNTVRNIAGCPRAGICPLEAFDTSGYPAALSEYLLKDTQSFQLPRKYKIAFSGCGDDCGLATVNDLGFIAKERDQKQGFRVYAGGGLGSSPSTARVLEDFVPCDQVGYIAEAIKQVFNKHGNRRNRNRARLRFLIEDIGFQRFKELYIEELQSLKKRETIIIEPEETPSLPTPEGPGATSELDDEYERWAEFNLDEQKQTGYYLAKIRIPLGDIAAEKLKDLALTADRLLARGSFRLTRDQNLILANIPEHKVAVVYEALKNLELAQPWNSTVRDITACKGALTCNLGLCNSQGLARELEAELEKVELSYDLLKQVRIKINGCPNACGLHPIGTLALHGVVRKKNLRPVPHYQILAGGRVEEDKTRLAEKVGLVPARSVVEVLKEFLIRAQSKLTDHGNFHDFLDNNGRELLKKIIDEHSYIPDYNDDPSYYRDWGASEDFTLEGLGTGECGAGVLDMIESDLEEAQGLLNQAKSGKPTADVLRKALHVAARALLVVRGIEPKNERQVVEAFIEQFVETDIADERFHSLSDIQAKLFEGELMESDLEEITGYLEDFAGEIGELYSRMDNNFQFPTRKEKDDSGENDTIDESEVSTLDLKGVPCPLNYVKAKLFLEERDSGAIADFILDDGEPIRNVPKSLKNDGHTILLKEKMEAGPHYRLRVKKN